MRKLTQKERDKRRLAAILFADIAGYTAIMQQDEKRGLQLLHKFQTGLKEAVKNSDGEIIKNVGDGSICIFATALSCVECAKAVQQAMLQAPEVPLRIGLHEGDVVFKGGDIYGDTVNVAARIESMGIAGNVLLSQSFYQKVKNQAAFNFQSLGHFAFKNVELPIEVYALKGAGLVIPKRQQLKGKFKEKSIFKKAVLWLLPFLLIAVGIGSWQYFHPAKEVIAPTIEYANSIAFLQLEDLSPAQDQQYLGDAIVTEMISLMGQIPNLKVIGSTSSFYFKDKDLSIMEIGKTLGVNYLVAGSFARRGENLKLHLNLLDVATGEIIKPFRRESSLDDMFYVQENLAVNLANQIKISIKEDFFKNQQHPQKEAYLLTYKASHLADKNIVSNVEEIKKLLLKSYQIDSTYAFTLEELCFFYNDLQYYDKLSYEEAKIMRVFYLNKLLQIDSTSESALLVEAMNYSTAFDFVKEKEKLEILLSKDKLSVSYLSAAGVNIGRMGYLDRGIAICKRAMEIDPLYIYNFYNLAGLYYLQEQYEESIAMRKKFYILYPDGDKELLAGQSSCYVLQGKYSLAKEEALKMENEMWKYSVLVLAEYGLGNKALSTQLLEQYIEKYGQLDAFCIAACYSYRGELDEAFQWLDYAIEAKDAYVKTVKFDPLFKNLHTDARWDALLKRLNYPDLLEG